MLALMSALRVLLLQLAGGTSSDGGGSGSGPPPPAAWSAVELQARVDSAVSRGRALDVPGADSGGVVHAIFSHRPL